MNAIPWNVAFAVFIGTLPIFGAIIWNLIEVKSIRAELLQIRGELAEIRNEIADIRKTLQLFGERIATLEERDRWEHPLVKP